MTAGGPGMPPRPPDGLDDRQVAGAALAGLPGMTAAGLRRLLDRLPDPRSVVRALRAGRAVELLEPVGGFLRSAASRWEEALDLAATRALLERRGTRVLLESDPGFPVPVDLPGCPAVLFCEGAAPEALHAPRVAIVGTRAATPAGLADASQLGAFLAAAGVTVVSGLAIGIDGAAHDGALRAGGRAVGVVATGLDIAYPRRHLVLHERVRRQGLLVAENWFGTRPHPSRFPVRNRILAALADVVVIVEATLTGGSRITAERALDYGRHVLTIPGSRRNPAAAGCNALLADGALPLLDPSDVLVALGMSPGARRGWPCPSAERPLSSSAAAVHRSLAGEPAHPDELSARTGLPPDRLAVAIEELVGAGRVERSRGFVWPV